MTSRDDKVHIKLEICRNKNSNKLEIMTHFDLNAPNFSKDNEGYFWIPTLEEKDFLNDAFQLMSNKNFTHVEPVKTTPTANIHKKEEIPEPKIEKEEKIEEENHPDEKEEKSEDIPPLEKEEEAIFETTEEEPVAKEEKKEDKSLIRQADEDAIDKALRKNQEKDKDRSMIEADEQTIIEKVLSQKKKGKWSSKNH